MGSEFNYVGSDSGNDSNLGNNEFIILISFWNGIDRQIESPAKSK